jgi:hypothetical protein
MVSVPWYVNVLPVGVAPSTTGRQPQRPRTAFHWAFSAAASHEARSAPISAFSFDELRNVRKISRTTLAMPNAHGRTRRSRRDTVAPLACIRRPFSSNAFFTNSSWRKYVLSTVSGSSSDCGTSSGSANASRASGSMIPPLRTADVK